MRREVLETAAFPEIKFAAAVVVADAAGADLYAAHGRYLYFSPDEVEVLA